MYFLVCCAILVYVFVLVLLHVETEQKLSNVVQHVKDKYNLIMYDEETQIHDDTKLTVKEFYNNLENNMRTSLFQRLQLMEMTQEQNGSVYKNGVCPHLPEGYIWQDGIVVQRELESNIK